MSRTYLRGDVYYAYLGRGISSEQEGYRPVLIIQNNTGNKYSSTVVVAAISSKVDAKAKLPTHYLLKAENGLELPSLVLSDMLHHQPVAVAVAIQVSSASETKSALCVSFRVQLDHLKLFGYHIGQQGNVVGFCHRMVDGNEVLVFYLLALDLVVFVRSLSIQSRKRHTAAADNRISQGVDHVAADGADIQLGAKQIGGSVLIDDSIAFHEFHDGDAEGGGKRFKERDIRQPFGGLPLGNRLAANIDLVCKFCLGHLFLLTQLLDGVSGDI